MTEHEWIELAKRRILKVLGKRRVASNRQLEKKISEAGPGDIRPEPMKISLGIQELLRDGRVLRVAEPGLPLFYTPANFGGESDEERRRQITGLSREFLALARNPQACGKALERVVYDAARQSFRYHVLGTPERPPSQGFAINGYVLETECDHILIPADFQGPKLIVEDKNLREWLHPSAEEVWSVIGKALRIPNAIPILICRRMHWLGFAVFKNIGLLCWQTYKQFFAPERVSEDQLEPLRDSDLLGFSDLTTDLAPPPALINFFSTVVPNNIQAFRDTFEAQRDLLTHYAIKERMEAEINGARRSFLFHEFLQRLRAV